MITREISVLSDLKRLFSVNAGGLEVTRKICLIMLMAAVSGFATTYPVTAEPPTTPPSQETTPPPTPNPKITSPVADRLISTTTPVTGAVRLPSGGEWRLEIAPAGAHGVRPTWKFLCAGTMDVRAGEKFYTIVPAGYDPGLYTLKLTILGPDKRPIGSSVVRKIRISGKPISQPPPGSTKPEILSPAKNQEIKTQTEVRGTVKPRPGETWDLSIEQATDPASSLILVPLNSRSIDQGILGSIDPTSKEIQGKCFVALRVRDSAGNEVGAHRVSVEVRQPRKPTIKIESPEDGGSIKSETPVIGIVDAEDLTRWVLLLREGDDEVWKELNSGKSVKGGKLGLLDPKNLRDGISTLQLKVYLQGGDPVTREITVTIAKSWPSRLMLLGVLSFVMIILVVFSLVRFRDQLGAYFRGRAAGSPPRGRNGELNKKTDKKCQGDQDLKAEIERLKDESYEKKIDEMRQENQGLQTSIENLTEQKRGAENESKKWLNDYTLQCNTLLDMDQRIKDLTQEQAERSQKVGELEKQLTDMEKVKNQEIGNLKARYRDLEKNSKAERDEAKDCLSYVLSKGLVALREDLQLQAAALVIRQSVRETTPALQQTQEVIVGLRRIEAVIEAKQLQQEIKQDVRAEALQKRALNLIKTMTAQSEWVDKTMGGIFGIGEKGTWMPEEAKVGTEFKTRLDGTYLPELSRIAKDKLAALDKQISIGNAETLKSNLGIVRDKLLREVFSEFFIVYMLLQEAAPDSRTFQTLSVVRENITEFVAASFKLKPLEIQLGMPFNERAFSASSSRKLSEVENISSNSICEVSQWGYSDLEIDSIIREKARVTIVIAS